MKGIINKGETSDSSLSVGDRLSYAAKLRIRGKLPQKRDVSDWGTAKLMALLKFVNHFTRDGKFDCSIAKVTEAQMRGEDESFWDEFLERINSIPGKDGGTSLRFRLRLTSLARVPLVWLKENPHAITAEMFELMNENPRLNWATRLFTLVTTENGAEVVLQDKDENTDPGRKNALGGGMQIDTPLVRYETSKLKMLSLLEALSKSIPASELKQMTVKDRLAAFDRLMNTATKVMSGAKPNSIVFSQININKTGRDELEKAVLGYAESQVIDT